MNMTLVLATACAMMDWEHEVTPLSNTVEYVLSSHLTPFDLGLTISRRIIATCFPKDGCHLKLTPRVHS